MAVLNNLPIALLLVLCCCNQSEESATTNNTSLLSYNKEQSDSIKLVRALDEAIQIANKHIESDSFSESFKTPSAGGDTIMTRLTVGKLFGDRQYLMVRRSTPNLYIEIFLRKDHKFEKVISHEESAMTYVNDTIQDVNGDGRKDFLVDWYAVNGCCLRNFIDVYLQMTDGTFTKVLEFINPTFSIDEQIIRGVTYGHPGEDELYKYKWNNFQVDTIEYIYHSVQGRGHFTRSKYLPYDKRNNQGNIISLDQVPDEYRGICGFNWFMNYRME